MQVFLRGEEEPIRPDGQVEAREYGLVHSMAERVTIYPWAAVDRIVLHGAEALPGFNVALQPTA